MLNVETYLREKYKFGMKNVEGALKRMERGSTSYESARGHTECQLFSTIRKEQITKIKG